MGELLACRPILHSRDIEETRAFLATRAIVLDVLGRGRQRAGFDVRYNGVYLPRLWLGYIRYGAPVTARIQPSRGDYWIHFPVHGRLEVSAGCRTEDCDPRQAALVSPLEVSTLRTGADGARLTVSIHGDALARHLADLLDDAPREPLRLASTLDLETGFGRGFADLLRSVAHGVCASGALPHPLVANDFEQLVMTSVLLSVPHNHSEALRRRDRSIAPRDVRRAVDYLREHAAQPLTLGDLVRVSGVAGRTLLKHFRDAYGVSPMRYLRNHRLLRAREELLRDPECPVSEVAMRWGFAHLGRFAQEYRRRFGESPSRTGRAPRTINS